MKIAPGKIWKRHVCQIIQFVNYCEIDNACMNGKETIDYTIILRGSERLKVR